MSKVAVTVDDSKTMRDMVAFTLKSNGFEVLEAEDGEQALEVIGDQKVDIIITDLNMPKMNGIELVRALRGKDAFKFTPILMLTTESEGSKKEEGKQAGATGWIVKPIQSRCINENS
jgi:two-component system chemotaxis response regulator CheY